MVSGIVHPIFGMDHLLAMVAVGIIAVQRGNKALWKLPLTFVSAMVLGGVLALMEVTPPTVETAIALSVLVLGVYVILSRQLSLNLAMVTIAFFALFHGYAHGSEMPMLANPVLYALGFVASTALLHFTGALLATYFQKSKFSLELLRFAGAGISAVGMLFLFGF